MSSSFSAILPDTAAFAAALQNHNLVPVHRTMLADLDTPLSLFAKIAENSEQVFLFESMEGGEKWGRYSFIGFDPLITFTSQGPHYRIAYPGQAGMAPVERDGNPFQALRELMRSFRVAKPDDTAMLPRFYGGLVGYLGYDMVRFVEKLPDRHPMQDMPDSALFIPRILLIHDHLKQLLRVVCTVWLPETSGLDATALHAQACSRIDAVCAQLRGPVPAGLCRHEPAAKHVFHSSAGPDGYRKMVERAREYVLAGDVIQVVPSQRFEAEAHVTPFAVYRALRHVNPSPYLFFLRQSGITLIGSSPEILVRLEEERITVRPIAGTRKRGRTAEEDQELERELRADEKERAEHLMLVDLGRNDVGRVATPGTVQVQELLVVERYSHVMHLVSGVQGRLAPGKDQFDVFAASFPAGTVSGAPKIRAMEIIDELECCRRGPYAGAVGYFGFSGNMDFCIALRTCVHTGKTLWVQAGAGIVADSDPEREHEETVNKSMAIRKAVELAEQEL